jgi:hypothetical protein
MRNIFLALMGAILLTAGCTSVDPARVRKQVGDKSVVVVVNVANELPLTWVGTTPLNNESSIHSSADWTIRHWIEERAVALLRESGRNARALVLTPGGQLNLASLIDRSSEVVVVISPGYGPDKVFDRPPFVTGIGLRQRTWFGMDASSATYLRLDARLLNPSHPDDIHIVSSESFQRLPFVALDKGPVMLARVQGAVRDVIRVQIDGAVIDLFGKLGLFEGPYNSNIPMTPSTDAGPRG